MAMIGCERERFSMTTPQHSQYGKCVAIAGCLVVEDDQGFEKDTR